MKRFAILIGALCAATVLLVYCTSVEFDNPLDKKGDNYLFNDDRYKDNSKALETDENGLSLIFNPDSIDKYWKCDGRNPSIWLVGVGSVTVNHGVNVEFAPLMSTTPGVAVDWHNGSGEGNRAGSSLKPIEITPPPSTMTPTPPPGKYTITYTVDNIRDLAPCPGFTPEPARIVRQLEIKEFTVQDERPPRITISGENPLIFEKGTTFAHANDVKATEFSNQQKELPLIKVELRREDGSVINTRNLGTIPPNYSGLNGDVNNLSVGTYRLVYFATDPANSKDTNATRTLTVREKQDGGSRPVIVLNMYTHSYGGVTFKHPDTAIAVDENGRALGAGYQEKGVERVYYIGSGSQEITICGGTSGTPCAPPLVTQSTFGTGRGESGTVTYTVPAGSGYSNTTLTRTVYRRWQGVCAPNETIPPDILLTPETDPLPVSGSTWAPTAGWSVKTNEDDNSEDGPASRSSVKYLVGSANLSFVGGTNTPNLTFDLTEKAGSHTVVYVGISGCGAINSRTRTINVTP